MCCVLYKVYDKYCWIENVTSSHMTDIHFLDLLFKNMLKKLFQTSVPINIMLFLIDTLETSYTRLYYGIVLSNS